MLLPADCTRGHKIHITHPFTQRGGSSGVAPGTHTHTHTHTQSKVPTRVYRLRGHKNSGHHSHRTHTHTNRGGPRENPITTHKHTRTIILAVLDCTSCHKNYTTHTCVHADRLRGEDRGDTLGTTQYTHGVRQIAEDLTVEAEGK